MKLLFGLAAARCSHPMCSDVCIASAPNEEVALVGDIAHIRGRGAGSARHDPTLPPQSIDVYENWILLCANHHRLVDQQPKMHPSTLLYEWKREHERWVAERLDRVRAAAIPGIKRLDEVLFRIAPAERPLWEGTARPGRFSDPFERFNTLHLTSLGTSAYIDALARWRPDPHLAALMTDEVGSHLSVVPKDVLARYNVGSARIRARVVDLREPDVVDQLDRLVRSPVGRVTLGDLVTGPLRLSQEVTRRLFDAGGDSGPRVDGVLYPSKFVSGAHNVAVWHVPELVVIEEGPVRPDDPALAEALHILGLRVA